MIASDVVAQDKVSRLPPLWQKGGGLTSGEVGALKAELGKAELAKDLALQSNVLSRLAVGYYAIGDDTESEKVAAQSEKLIIEAAGADSLLHARQLHHWAKLEQYRYRFDLVQVRLERALPVLERELPGGHSEVMDARETLAHAYMRQAKSEKAVELLGRFLEASEKTHGPNSVEHAVSLAMVAQMYAVGDQEIRAEPLARKAISQFESLNATKSYGYPTSLRALGLSMMGQERPADAERYLRLALAANEKIYEPGSASLAQSLGDLATVIKTVANIEGDKKRLAEAETLQRRVVKVNESNHGETSPQLVLPLTHLAVTLMANNKLVEAEQYMARAVKLSDTYLSKRDTQRINVRVNYVTVLQEIGKLKEAEKLCDETHDEAEKTFGRKHVTFAEVLEMRGAVYRGLDRKIEAEQAYWEAATIRKAVLGPDHRTVAGSLFQVARLCDERGDHKNAESMFRRVIEIYRKEYGPDSFNYANGLHFLGINLKDQKRYKEAEKVLRDRVAALERRISPAHADLGEAQRDIAHVLMENKNFEDAIPVLRRALEVHRAALGDQHVRTGISLYYLSLALFNAQKYHEAEKFGRECYLMLCRKPRADRPNDETMGNIRQLNEFILYSLKLQREDVFDRIDQMYEGIDPGPLRPSKT